MLGRRADRAVELVGDCGNCLGGFGAGRSQLLRQVAGAGHAAVWQDL
jgi:hypothetical protein